MRADVTVVLQAGGMAQIPDLRPDLDTAQQWVAGLMETLPHGWDLAVATGQHAEADPALVAKAHSVAEQALTDDSRGPGLPFGPQVEPHDEAGPTERFAAFLGRSRP